MPGFLNRCRGEPTLEQANRACGGAAHAAQGESSAAEKPGTLLVERKRTVAGDRPATALGAGTHPPRSSERRDTADECEHCG